MCVDGAPRRTVYTHSRLFFAPFANSALFAICIFGAGRNSISRNGNQRSVVVSDLLDRITVPTLLLDESRARANLARIAGNLRAQGIRFRPHFKTHQSAEIGEWFRAEGITAITVSSVRMAEYFANAGWDDILIAFPANLRELPAMNALARRVRLGVLVESMATLAAVAAGIEHPVDVWLETDTGYQRSGLPVTTDEKSAQPFADLCALAQAHPHLTVRGFVSHSGHSYGYAQPGRTLDALFDETIGLLKLLQGRLAALGHANLEISLGDTPMASVVANLHGADELRPGNFIFYDWMQYAFGSCAEPDIAVAVAAPVVANYPDRHEVILYSGAVHLGKEMMPHPSGGADYGHIAPLSANGWGSTFADVWLRSLSQEHGIVRGTPEAYARDLAALKPGDLVAVLPIHSCLTADLLKHYLTLDGRTIEMLRL